MASYTIRIQLAGSPDADTYDALHAALKRHQIRRVIQAGDGSWWKLPYGTYHANLDNPASTEEVRDLVAGIARWYNYAPDVIVSNSNDIAWWLYPVHPSEVNLL